MEDFRQHIIELLSDLPKKESALLSEDWRFFLLLPRLHGLVQEKLFAVFTQETLQDVEKNRGLDYGYFIEEVMQNIRAQEHWLDSLGILSESKYLIDRTQKQFKATEKQLGKRKKDLAISFSRFQELKQQVQELEAQANELERLKAAEEHLRIRKKELEALQKWVADNNLSQLEKEVGALEEALQSVEAERSGLQSRKEKLIATKEELSIEVERLLDIQERLEGANRILEEWAPSIQAYNERLSGELKEESEILGIHHQANQAIAKDLNVPDSLKDKLTLLEKQLMEFDRMLAKKILENEKNMA